MYVCTVSVERAHVGFDCPFLVQLLGLSCVVRECSNVGMDAVWEQRRFATGSMTASMQRTREIAVVNIFTTVIFKHCNVVSPY